MSLSVEREWAALVAPYAEAAERLGFSFVEHRVTTGIPPSPETTFGCLDFHFDGHTTFLDLGGTLARGPYHRGLLIGMNSVQLYTFLRAPEITLVLTNGSPSNVVEFLAGKRRWNAFIRLAETLIPKDHAAVEVRGPEDLALVVRRHRELVAKRGGEPIEVTGPPLEFRWQITEQWEKSDRPW